MAITYNAGTNTITLDGVNTYNLHDIKLADMAGGWGVVSEAHGNQFFFRCKLVVGDGTNTTQLIDTMKLITFDHGIVSSHTETLIDVLINSLLRFGNRISSTYTTEKGCSLILQEHTYSTNLLRSNTGTIELFSCCVTGNQASPLTIIKGLIVGEYADPSCVVRIFNSVLSGVATQYIGSADFYNVYYAGAYVSVYSISPTLNYVTVRRCAADAIAFARYDGNITCRNVKVIDNLGANRLRGDIVTGNAYLIDSEIDSWTIYWERSPYPDIYRQNSFDARVIDETETAIPGAGVKIWDFGGVLVTDTTTNATGYISTQTLSFGYYSQPHGNTPTMKTPHTIEISKTGYQSYVTKFTVNKKISWILRLLETQPIQFMDNDLILQIAPESIENDRYIFTKV